MSLKKFTAYGQQPDWIELWQGTLLFVVGCVTGFINVMASGGSLISVPVMVFLRMPGPVANGTNRIAILAQNLTAIAAFFKKGFSNFRLSLSLSAMAIPGSVAGAMMGAQPEGVWFNRTIAIIMICVMLITMFEKKLKAHQTEIVISRKRMIIGHLIMILVGFYGGFIQLGVGFIIMPVLNRVVGFNLVRVNMHKVFTVGSYTIAALIVFASRVKVSWLLGFSLAFGNALGGWFGAYCSVIRGEGIIKLVLSTLLIIFIIKLLLF